jgi:serine phosphatase RsbU (regulator of sigma subunit)
MARDQRRDPPGPPPLDDTALLKALSWVGYFSLRPRLTTIIGVVAVIAVLIPFALVNPIPYFGMPGALATGVAIAAAIAAGPLPGVIVAAVAGGFFILFVADPAHHFHGASTYATVAIWMVVALIAGFVADHLRSRLDHLFREVETRDERIRGTLEATTAAVGLFTGPDLRCRNANARLRSLFVSGEWVDRPLAELIPGLPPSLAGELQACVVGDQSTMQVSEVFMPAVRRTYSISARCRTEATEPTLFVTMIDVTSSLRVRHALERLLALTQELHVGQTPRQVAEAACRIATEMFGCETASFWDIQGDEIDIVARIPGPPPIGAWKLEEIADLRRLIDAREPVFIYDVQEHFSGDGSQTRLESYFKGEGYRSLLGLPISYGDMVGALLFLAWHEHVDHPTDELLIVARRLADEAAIAIERARRLQQQQQRLAAEEETARLLKRLEQSLLPRPQLSTPRLRVEYHYVAGEEKMHIGGDFLGAVETPSGELALVIGDVSGHGPDSAALGATLRASWRAMAMAGLEPAEVMARLEQVLERDRSDDAEFVTVCCAWLDPDGSRLRVVLGGHHRPLLLDDGVREIDIAYGPALGMFPGERWAPAEVELPHDWALLFYTDGLVEGRAEAGSSERLGLQRLVGLLEKNGSADDIDHAGLVRLVDEVRLANGTPLADDVAVLFVAPRVPTPARA